MIENNDVRRRSYEKLRFFILRKERFVECGKYLLQY